MQLEFLDQPVLFWVFERDRKVVAEFKEKLFAGECKNKMDHVPPEIFKIMEYIDGLVYTSTPDYEYIRGMISCAAKTCDVDLDNKFDWEDGKPKFKRYKKKRSWFFGGSDEKEKKKKKKPRSDKEDAKGTGTDTAKQGTSTGKPDDTNDKEKDKSDD
uniref:Uncharacterized protein n=1 Tax=Panagrolaimus sp. JU765 TaxID=591449 RepID=A0AC34QSF3_9BILA